MSHSVEHELAANATSLRHLARDLVGRDRADDLVQETALRALQSPPSRPTGLGAWLATILRRLAASHRRQDQRRTQREIIAARTEALGSVDDAAMRRESLRAVTAALFALPEPYQTTLLLRYFEGLSPGAIAERTATPLPTVKSRLQRGLLLMRGELDRRSGSWRAGLMLATGIAAEVAAAASLTVGVLLMAKALKLVGAAALATGAIVAWQVGSAPASPPHSGLATDHIAPAPEAMATTLDDERPAERSAAPVEDFPGVDLAHSFAFALRCQVIDYSGLPVSDRKVALWPLGCADNEFADQTDARGTAVLRWHGRRALMPVGLRVGDGPVRTLAIEAGAERAITLLGVDSGSSNFRLAANAVGEMRLRLGHSVRLLGSSSFLDNSDQPLQPTRGLHPELVFADLRASATDRVAVLSDMPIVGRFFSERLVATDLALSFEAVVVQAQVEGLKVATPPDLGTIVGIVFGEDGRPVANTLVCRGLEPDLPLERVTTDDDGTFRFENVPLGPAVLRAGGGRLGLGRATTVVVGPGGPPVSMQLQREQTIRGTAFGRDQKPLTDWWVSYEALDGTWVDRARVHEDGTFVLPNLPGRAGRLWLHQQASGLASRFVPSMLPDSGAATFDLGGEAATNGSIRLRLPPDDVAVAAPPADEAAAARALLRAVGVQVWQQETGLRTLLQRGDDGVLTIANLPAGFYRLEGGSVETGVCDLGTHWVDGKGCLDLGLLTLPDPGTLRIENAPPDAVIELYHRREHSDVRAMRQVQPGEDLRLPAGKWLLFFRVGEGAAQLREFALGANTVTAIDLGG